MDDLSGIETTGHEWDGIKELNNPLPRWWLWTFYATIVFSIGYVIYYPAIPLITTATSGVSGITNRQLVEQDMAAAAKAQGVLLDRIATTPIDKIRDHEDLYRFAIAGGKSNFKVYCSQCHGSGAQGAPGYPNLNDDDWLWGGDLAAIYTTIAHGVRNEEDDDTRTSEMPAFAAGGVLTNDQIRDIAEYVLKLSGREFDASMAGRGGTVYAEQCASCHGENGKGGREFGAPNLADALSLYGGERDKIVSQIRNPNHGVMPGWIKRLGKARVKQLAVYVHSLGGGEKAKTQE
ncbi:MAG: cytochrome-c oxidase, cbb3-type subunit III [Hyphomicrobiaceae bacterium]